VAAYSAAPPDLVLEADVILIAVRDDKVSEVAQKLVATGLITRHHIMLHCSGAVSAEVAFESVRDRVGGVATLHPLRAIPTARDAMRDLKGTLFGVQGDDAGRRAATALVDALGGQSLVLEGTQMAAYHAAAALASNQLIALLSVAVELLGSAGIGEEQALAAITPLVEGTLKNVAQNGLRDALTGPIRRGDKATIERHLEVVSALPAHVGALYRELGLRTVEVARGAEGADGGALDAIEALLSRPLSGLRRATGDS
jgi:predicted short-subunit dehydrogenase-like oxidoreductase (DUF2520 family)